MTFQATKCDECGALKGESNHWIKMQRIAQGNGKDCLVLGDVPLPGPGLTPLIDICGQSCAMKQVARLLGWTSSKETAA